MSGWVYILLCCDDSYYIGSTVNLQGRIGLHTTGQINGWTASRLPLNLVFSQEFYTIEEALRAERQIKGWSRAKKEALMDSDFDLLVELAKNSKLKEATGLTRSQVTHRKERVRKSS
ncbi:MAG: GIY-YIG nuclease family protein [candidate division Zixibacteria bacterium]|nr:GIY-YIG nuclease family protein [candidate division Zixibacteria bacterium]